MCTYVQFKDFAWQNYKCCDPVQSNSKINQIVIVVGLTECGRWRNVFVLPAKLIGPSIIDIVLWIREMILNSRKKDD